MVDTQQHTEEQKDGKTVVQVFYQTPPQETPPPATPSSVFGGEVFMIIAGGLAVLLLLWALSRTPAEPDIYQPPISEIPTSSTNQITIPDTQNDLNIPTAEPQPIGDY